MIRAIAGDTGAGATEPGIVGPVVNGFTDPIYFDVTLSPGEAFKQSSPAGHNVAVFVLSGTVLIGDRAVLTEQFGILGAGADVEIAAGPDGASFLFIAAKRLDEPVARGGPFVMNTQEEVMQAFADYQLGNF